jgi:hypothetical protein
MFSFNPFGKFKKVFKIEHQTVYKLNLGAYLPRTYQTSILVCLRIFIKTKLANDFKPWFSLVSREIAPAWLLLQHLALPLHPAIGIGCSFELGGLGSLGALVLLLLLLIWSDSKLYAKLRPTKEFELPFQHFNSLQGSFILLSGLFPPLGPPWPLLSNMSLPI